ncbi:hypothetical protein M8J77_010939 [Diaphorina citri]|nr:hypothetical protein M8J77_010939 [Diaphorina citri]
MTPANTCDKDLKTLLQTSSKPFLIKNQLKNWEPLSWPLSKWFDLFNIQSSLIFRCGENGCSKEPQWESKCQYENLTPEQFIEHAEHRSTNKWMYFDYKHLAEWSKADELAENQFEVPWDLVGFPEQGFNETTLWIGSRGAHTPCHSDTYGYNLVAQVIGRKQWILYPPSDADIVSTQTRIPYEESSIYSTVNFHCGKSIQDSSVRFSQPYIVTVEPGDVLLVPHRWWHYVEHLSTGLSLNTWIPLHNKAESYAYLDEWLVRCIVRKLTQDLPVEERRNLLNPNEMDIGQHLQDVCLDEMTLLLRRHQTLQDSRETSITKETTIERVSSESLSNANVQELAPLSKEEFREFCLKKCPCMRKFLKGNSENGTRVCEKESQTSDLVMSRCEKSKNIIQTLVSSQEEQEVRYKRCRSSSNERTNQTSEPNTCHENRGTIQLGTNRKRTRSISPQFEKGQILVCNENQNSEIYGCNEETKEFSSCNNPESSEISGSDELESSGMSMCSEPESSEISKGKEPKSREIKCDDLESSGMSLCNSNGPESREISRSNEIESSDMSMCSNEPESSETSIPKKPKSSETSNCEKSESSEISDCKKPESSETSSCDKPERSDFLDAPASEPVETNKSVVKSREGLDDVHLEPSSFNFKQNHLVHAFTHPDVIRIVREKILEQLQLQ